MSAIQILQAQFQSSSFLYSYFLRSMRTCIIWDILNKEKAQTPLSQIIIRIPQNSHSFKGCTALLSQREDGMCTLPGIGKNMFTHTQLRKLTSFADVEIGFFLSPPIAFSLPHTNARSSWLVPPQQALSHRLASPLCSFVFHLSRAGSPP